MREAVQFLSKPGNTVADLIQSKEQAGGEALNTNESDPLGLR